MFRATQAFLLIRAALGTLEFQAILCLFFPLLLFFNESFLLEMISSGKISDMKVLVLSYWSDVTKKNTTKPFGIFQLSSNLKTRHSHYLIFNLTSPSDTILWSFLGDIP